MCGIFGWIGLQHNQKLLAQKCRDQLSHRGPDSDGEWYDAGSGVWLGHTRLSILDLSKDGNQPMTSTSGRFVLTYNGEVYNYLELRTELKKAGVQFRGSSDSEVVLAACETWGVEIAVKRFEGMFAFAFYDREERILWLVRDSIGIKPLYYAHLNDQIVFSSELTPLLSIDWVDQSIDQDALFSYFRYLCVSAPASILKGVKKLTSGSLLRFSQGKLFVRSFWDLATQCMNARIKSQRMSLQEAADELEFRLRQSVRQHMLSDVPYGAFLSGGIDSSSVVALMQAESSHPVKTFSIGFSEASHDESAYSRAVSEHLGTEHHELILHADEIPALVPTIAGIYDEPFADNSSIPTYLVSRFARNLVTVCLSGDGGDELFGGYPRYFWGKRIEGLRQCLRPKGARIVSNILQAVPQAVWNRIVNPAFGYRFSGSEGLANRVRRFGAYLGCDRNSAYANTMSVWSNPGELLDFQPECLLGADAIQYPNLSWSEEMMLIDQANYLQEDILTKIDRASMAVSLEARVPLLTHPMVEWSWQLDPSLKLADKGDQGKLVLREVLYRYVPKKLIERPKLGFGLPMDKWLRGPLKEWAESLLVGADLEACGLQSDVVNKVWRKHQAGFDRQAMLWTVLMYRQWYQRVMS